MTVTPSAPHQALYRRWRAQTFGQMVGQEAVVTTLRNAVRDGHVAHALLFVGPRGTGKTSTARIVAKALNCDDVRDGEPDDRCPSCVAIREGRALDVIELDAASNNRVDDIRELLPRIYTAPSDLRRKVFIVDEVQRIKEGWDLLLKTLEEPPEHVAFIFCTTDSSGIRPAVLSRVQRFDFRRLSVEQIAGKLRAILAADGRAADEDAIALVAELAAGGMRDAESMLDQLLASGAERISADQVRDLLGLAEQATVDAFADALVAGDAAAGLRLLDELDDRGRDLRVFLDQLVDRLRGRLVAELGSGAGSGSAELAAAARRLAAIDPGGPGAGGLRLQLELAVLAPLQAPPEVRQASPDRRAATRRPERSAAAAVPSARRPAAAPAHGTEPASAPEGPGGGLDRERAPARPGVAAPLDGGELADLLRRWAEVVASFRPATRALIAECRPLAIDAGVVTLGFPETKAFLKAIAESKRTDLEAGFSRFLGRGVAVRCVGTNLEAPASAPADAEAERLLAEARRIFADDLVDVGEVS